jgi:hypothetical protein
MGYFDGIVNAAFKTDRHGQTVFYPWGAFGRGRVLKDPAAAAGAKLFLRRYYQFTLCAVGVLSAIAVNPSVGLPVKVGAAAAYFVIFIGWFFVGARKYTSDAEYSDERLSVRESQANTAASMSRGMLWAFLLLCCVFTAGGVRLIAARLSKANVAAGWAAVVIFPLCGLIFIRMLRLKGKSP